MTKYTFSSTVLLIEEKKRFVYVSGVGKDATSKEVSLGWFIWLEGSYESLYVGAEKPEMVKGDRVKVTIERVV